MESGVFRWTGEIIRPREKDERKGRMMRKPGEIGGMAFRPEVITASHWLLKRVRAGKRRGLPKERRMSWRVSNAMGWRWRRRWRMLK